MQFSSVDLPQPDGPSSTMNSPSAMSRLRFFSTVDRAEVQRQVLDWTMLVHMVQPFTAPAAMPRTKSLPETK